MRELLQSALVICTVLLVPVVPFLVFGSTMDAWITSWLEQHRAGWMTALAIVAILSTDILLPIPASVVSTFGGMWLGTFSGTFASWSGMTLGALLGFLLSRWLGSPFVRCFTRDTTLEKMRELSTRLGPLALFVTRGVPVLAEASVLLMGIHRLSWRRFLPPVLLGNLVLSFGYAAIGEIADQHDWAMLALVVSIMLPVLLALTLHRFFKRSSGL